MGVIAESVSIAARDRDMSLGYCTGSVGRSLAGLTPGLKIQTWATLVLLRTGWGYNGFQRIWQQ